MFKKLFGILFGKKEDPRSEIAEIKRESRTSKPRVQASGNTYVKRSIPERAERIVEIDTDYSPRSGISHSSYRDSGCSSSSSSDSWGSSSDSGGSSSCD